METEKHCVRERGCLNVTIYPTSMYLPAAAAQALTGWTSLILLTATGGMDNKSTTGLSSTYPVPGTSHASSTCDSIWYTHPPSMGPFLLNPFHRSANRGTYPQSHTEPETSSGSLRLLTALVLSWALCPLPCDHCAYFPRLSWAPQERTICGPVVQLTPRPPPWSLPWDKEPSLHLSRGRFPASIAEIYSY